MNESDSQSTKSDASSNSLNQEKGSNSKSKHHLIKFASVGVLLATLMPLFSSYSSVFELFSHFRLQMLIAAVLVTVLSVIYKCRFHLIPAAMAIAINGLAIYPLYFGAQARATVPNFRLLTLNVSVDNRDCASVVSCIRDSDADVICVQELSAEMSNYLAKNLTDYPYRLVDPREDPFGIGIFSRHYVNSDVLIPSESTSLTDEQSRRTKMTINSLMVGITIGDQSVKIICTHPPPPLRPDYFNWRNRQLDFIARMAAASKEPMFIAGDLNCSPYSQFFSKTLKDGNLNDSELGFGIQATWPTNMWPLAIPIDHVLYKGPIQVVNRRLGISVGSDHTPLVVSFRIGS